ncbi:MAG: hypothetical protein JNK82_34425 [Myxococcaceae bacterium]|nr:hypothetical protein [Myxococcaceae bacterium]
MAEATEKHSPAEKHLGLESRGVVAYAEVARLMPKRLGDTNVQNIEVLQGPLEATRAPR